MDLDFPGFGKASSATENPEALVTRKDSLHRADHNYIEKPELLHRVIKDYRILKVDSYPKYYRLKVKSAKKQKQILLCKYRNCRKTFSKIFGLEHHMMTHDNLRPYICPYCGNGFRQNTHLKRHVTTHL